MFHYSPPKSSVWGHLLRKMPAARASALLEEFLATAVAEHRMTGASLMLTGLTGDARPRFERLLGPPGRGGQYYELSNEQFRLCLDEIIRDETSAGGAPRGVLLCQSFEIRKWRVEGQEVATESQLMMYYGELPCMSTFFTFETVDQFHHIQRVLAELRLCKLNEKHLKPSRTKRA